MLFRLQQADIRTPLVTSGLDELFVSILRVRTWQNIRFPGVESREPYREALDPLLKWFEEIQKSKGRELSEESARNNCLPPGEIQLKTRTDQKSPPANGEQAPTSLNYIVRIFAKHFADGKAEDTCVIVFTSGAYHKVHRSQKLGSKEVKTAALDGSLPQDNVHSLREILDVSELKNRPPEDPPRGLIREGTVTHLSIPRGGKTQEVTVWKYFDAIGIGAARMPGVDDHGTKLLKPLNNWLKTNLHEEKESPSSDPPNPQCLPDVK